MPNLYQRFHQVKIKLNQTLKKYSSEYIFDKNIIIICPIMCGVWRCLNVDSYYDTSSKTHEHLLSMILQVVDEGNEDELFWAVLGGKQEYNQPETK